MKKLLTLLLIALGMSVAPHAEALTCYAITQNNRLLTFDTATPGTVTNDVAISGINPAYTVVGVALRTTIQPGGTNAGVGSLWGIAYNGTNFFLCTINPATGVAQQVGGVLALNDDANADGFGFGFDPAADRFRFISVQTNYALDPNTATFVQQTSFPGFPAQSGAAFVPSPYSGGTSQFYNLSREVTPRVLQTSTNVAAGSLTAVGPVNTGEGIFAPLGLAFGGNTLFLAVNEKLYTVNATTGTPTLVSNIGGAPTIRGIAIVPASFPPAASITVTIRGKKRYVTTKTRQLLRGTVNSNVGIDRVEYRVGSRGKFRRVPGALTPWRLNAPVKPGRNVVQVRAVKGSVISRPARVTVIRN